VRILTLLFLSLHGLSLIACAHPALTPAQFTRTTASALKAKLDGMRFEVLKDLSLRVTLPKGDQRELSLQKSYEHYLHEPGRKDKIIADIVAGTQEVARAAAVDASRLVPLIKNRAWLAGREMVIHDDLVSDLVVVYAQDQEKTIQYLDADDLAKSGVPRDHLRALAVENLVKNHPIEEHPFHGAIMLTTGGNYEASLILAEPILQRYRSKVKGSLVVAVPAADVILLTGSQDEDGLARVRQSIATLRQGNFQALAPQIFLCGEDGTISVLKP
jgi:hypothetical protein